MGYLCGRADHLEGTTDQPEAGWPTLLNVTSLGSVPNTLEFLGTNNHIIASVKLYENVKNMLISFFMKKKKKSTKITKLEELLLPYH